MSVPFTAKLVEKESVLIQTLDDGEAVLLNLDSEYYFSLNDGGSVMWNLLLDSPSIGDAYDKLVSNHPDVDPDVLQSDMNEFVDELVQHNLVDVQQPESDA